MSYKIFNWRINLTDPTLVNAIIALLFISITTLLSVAEQGLAMKQFAFVLISFLLVFVSFRMIDFSLYQIYANWIYIFNIILLIALKFFGATVLGSQRWLQLGPINIQPSEIAKVCLIVYLASWLIRNPIRNFLDIIKTLLIVAPPALLVLVQPDLGTTLVYIAITIGMLFAAGAKLIELVILVSPLISAILSLMGTQLMTYEHENLVFHLTAPGLAFLVLVIVAATVHYKAWKRPWVSFGFFWIIAVNLLSIVLRSFAWGFLKDYQQKRLTIFLDPYVDPLGAGYHIIQSLYAIGSGGFWGRGYQNGELTQGNFVPEQHTDFIYSAIGEEWGFVGTALVLFLYGLVLVKIIQIAKNTDDKFSELVSIGVFAKLFFHIFVNIGMTLSVMPITGVPLPFMSYGGSALLVDMFLISLVIKSGVANRISRKL